MDFLQHTENQVFLSLWYSKIFPNFAPENLNITKFKQRIMEKKIISIEKLLQTPVCMMSGEELAFLFNNLGVLDRDKKPESSMPSPDRKLAYGIKGIAETFGCSIPTANRIKKSGVIDKAISQLGRKIVIDVDMALELAAERKEDLHGNLH